MTGPVTKLAAYATVPTDLVQQAKAIGDYIRTRYGASETPEQARERAAHRAAVDENRARAAREREALLHDVPADSLDHAVLVLHDADERGECQGCDGAPEYGGTWPCRTYVLVAERNGRRFVDGPHGTRMERSR